jgi:hypothetical protein
MAYLYLLVVAWVVHQVLQDITNLLSRAKTRLKVLLLRRPSKLEIMVLDMPVFQA